MQLGIDRISRVDHILEGRRIGLIVNSASLDSRYRLTVEKIASRYRLSALFGPEHGVSGDLLAGEKVRSGLNVRYGVPEFSLYGDALAPTAEQLALIDALAGTDALRSGAWDAETFLQQSEESARAFTAQVMPEYRLY